MSDINKFRLLMVSALIFSCFLALPVVAVVWVIGEFIYLKGDPA